MRISEKHGAVPIYGDTDSIFLSLSDEDSIDMEEKINQELTEYVKSYNSIEKSTVYLEHEKKFGILLMLSKKKYTGNLVWMDGKDVNKIFSRGIEIVKKDTIGYTKKHLTDLVEMIVQKKATAEEVKEWLAERKREFFDDVIDPKDISVTVRIARSPSTYKTKLLHVRIADDRIKRGLMQDVQEGKTNAARITYVVTDGSKKLNGVHIDEFDGTWDRDWYWKVKVFAPFERLLEVAYPEINWKDLNSNPTKSLFE
jgi:DNA polymerase elongation subunit (family B)